MAAKTGSLSISSENIFPVIKKWLYSDHDIFYRELVSNGCDAVTKLKKLELMGEFEKPEEEAYKIQVTVNPKEKTIAVTDNGLGMTEEEVDEYINQIAFSGAQDLRQAVTLLWTVRLSWHWAYHGTFLHPGAAQFAFGFYSVMLTSTVLGLVTMVLFKPRSWCVYCPMGTMTQLICKVKNK